MKKKLIATASAATLAISGIAVPNFVAYAAPIEDSIKNLTVSGDAVQGGNLKVDIEWSIPDDAQPGDTFTVDLPEEFSAIETSFDLKDSEGRVIATADASSGDVVFTVADGAVGLVDRGGSAYFTVRVANDAELKTVTTKYGVDGTVETTISEKTKVDKFDRENPYKYGDHVTGTNEVKWHVTSVLGKDTTFRETAKPGESFKCEEVDASRTDVSPENGAWVADHFLPHSEVNCSESEITVTVNGVGENQVAALYLTTQYTPDAISGKNDLGYPMVRNDAELVVDGEPMTSGANATIWGAGGEAWGKWFEENEVPPKDVETPDPEPSPEPEPEVTPEPQPEPEPEEPCDCDPVTTTVEVPVTETKEVEVTKTVTETPDPVTEVQTVTETPAPVTTTKVVNETETVTVTETPDPVEVTKTVTETPDPVTSTVTETEEVEVVKTETQTVTTTAEPEPAPKTEEPRGGSSTDVLGKCVANATQSPIALLLPLGLLGYFGGNLAAPHMAQLNAQLGELAASVNARAGASASQFDNPFGHFGNEAARRANEVFGNNELSAAVNQANAQFQALANSPEVAKAGQVIGVVAALAVTAGLAYDWCSNEPGEAVTAFGSSVK